MLSIVTTPVKKAVFLSIFAISSASFGTSAIADDADGNYAVRGSGAVKCQAFSDAAATGSDEASTYVRWIAGYLSGLNFHLDNTYDVSPFVLTSDVAIIVLGQCGNEPNSSVENMTNRVVQILSPYRETARSDLTTVEFEGQSVDIRQGVMLRLQLILSALGYYEGEADGLYGPGTRSALVAFQTAKDIPKTGIPDRVTVLQLIGNAP